MRRIDLSDADAVGRVTRRSAVPDPATIQAATAIVTAVRRGGDAALSEAGERYGGGAGRPVTAAERSAALRGLDGATRASLEQAAANVSAAHRAQAPTDTTTTIVEGVVVERRWSPLRRVGAYVPGGAAPLPSTLIMTVVPARVAGVETVVVATPERPDGTVDPVVLAAAAILEVHEVRAMGGAQAIGALAFGTESLDRVDKIVGPGNAWVTAAKLAVSGECAIDMAAGPSEALVIADRSAEPRYVAADLIAQAEHGPDSPVALVVIEPETAERVLAEVAALLPRLERRPVIERALDDHGLVVVAGDLARAAAFADEYGPEHLSLHVSEPGPLIDAIAGAGSVFVGPWAPEPVGDYASGANHVLPTGGLARAAGPLSTEDFGSWRQVQHLTRDGLAALRPVVAALADAEGLGAHRMAVDIRFEEELPE